MIIFIRELPNIKAFSLSQQTALESILWACGRGRQILWMPVQLVETLQGCDFLGGYSKRVLERLKTSVVYDKHVLDSEFDFKIIVDFVNPYRMEQIGCELFAGYSIVHKETFLLAPILLTENEIDAKIYEKFSLACFSKRKKVSATYTIEMDPQGGGGPDIFKKYQRYVGENRPFVCLVDSDLKHPKGPLGGTCKQFRAIPQGYGVGSYLRIISSHEVENLIPENLVRELFPTQQLGHIFTLADSAALRRYPDHKNGFTVGDAKAQDEEYKDNFWIRFYSLKDKVLLCGKFNKLAEHACEFLHRESPRKIIEYMDEVADCELYTIAKIVADWGVRSRRELA